MRALDIVADLSRIKAPTLIVVGELDAVTPVEAAEEIVSGLSAGVGRLEMGPVRRPLHVRTSPMRSGRCCCSSWLKGADLPLTRVLTNSSRNTAVEVGQHGEHPTIVPGVLLKGQAARG